MYTQVYQFMKRNQPMPKEEWESVQRVLKISGYMDDDGRLTQKHYEHFADIFESIERDPKFKPDIQY